MTLGIAVSYYSPNFATRSGQCPAGAQGVHVSAISNKPQMVGPCGMGMHRGFYGQMGGDGNVGPCSMGMHRSFYGQMRGDDNVTQTVLNSRFYSYGFAKALGPEFSRLRIFPRFHSSHFAGQVGTCPGFRFRGGFGHLNVRCFQSSEPLGGSEPLGVNLGKGLINDKLDVSCNVQGSRSDNFDVGDLKIGAHAEVLGQDASELNLSQMKGSYSETNGAPYEEVLVAEVEEEATGVLLWWQQIPKRWLIVLLCFFAFLLCNMDRVNMSIAILPMSAEFHWNSTTVGLVQSSFFWGYLLTQIAGGIWADSVGGKQVLGFGVIWWSAATVLTPIAAKIGLPVLLFARACMGVGEGVAMPAMNNLLSRWVPVKERSRSLALVYSGMYLGSVTGLAFSPTLIHKFNWPSVFFSFGSLGVIWFTAWQRYAHSSPFDDPEISLEEKKLIAESSQLKESVTTIPWRLLLSKAPVWALIVCHFCHNWGTFILLTWMPTYYCQVLKFNLMESGMFSVLPWLTMALFANVGGWIADTLVSKGTSVTTVRKVMQTIGFLGPAFFLTQLSHVTTPTLAVMCMMCSQGCDAFSQSGLYSNHQDIGPRYSGVLLGLSNTAGVLAGVIGTATTGYILQHGTWDDVFKVAVGLYICGTVIWNIFSTGEQVFE